MPTPLQSKASNSSSTTGAVRSILDQAGDQVVLLAGSGRSGTTWVQELINYRQDHRVLFEPFWPEMVTFLPPQPSTHLYLRADDPAPYFQPHALRILRGEFYNAWADRTNPPGIYQRRLIKDVRANLLLKWLTTQMPTLKVVLLLRHPCAVSLSQIRTGWPSNLASQLRELTMQPTLFADFLAPFMPLIEATNAAFEANVLLWAIQNYVPLKQFGLHPDDFGEAAGADPAQAPIHLLFYEQLCTNPEAELSRLFDFLDLPLAPELFTRLHKPSLTAVGAPTEITGESTFDAWRDRVSTKQLANALTILQHFGLDRVYNDGAMPCYEQTKPVQREGTAHRVHDSSRIRDVVTIRPPHCTEQRKALLFAAADLLAESGIVHWIDFGTLLGAVQTQMLMPWEQSVHLAFVDSEPSLIPFLIEIFREEGYQVLYNAATPDDIRIYDSQSNGDVSNTVHLNLYAYHRTDDGMLRMRGAHNPANWAFPANFLAEMAVVTLYGRRFPAPAPLHEFLVNHRYGPGYQRPVPEATAPAPAKRAARKCSLPTRPTGAIGKDRPVIGLVMTQKNEAALLPHNLAYHRYLGVSHFYIFDDGSTDESMATIADQAGVQRFWEPDYTGVPAELSGTLTKALHGNWIARQHLNTYNALQLARADGVDWLLSLDADELVALDNTEQDALRTLCAEATPATEAFYFQRTYEVLPQCTTPPNVFRHAHRFKTPAYAYHHKREFLDPVQNQRFSLSFLSHTTGKSLVRTAADLRPFSSHDFVKRDGSKVVSQSVGRLMHYHFYSAADFINKNRLPHPNHFVYGGGVPYYPKLFWRDLVLNAELSDAEIHAYFAAWLVFSEDEIAQLQNTSVHGEPWVIADHTVCRVWEKIGEPVSKEMAVVS